MYRGTTPVLNCKVEGLDLSQVTVLWLTLKQGCTEITRTLDDVEIEGDTIRVELSQCETLKLIPNTNLFIQLRARIGEVAVASNKVRLDVAQILKDGVIE